MRVTVPNLPPGVPHAVQVRAIRDGLTSEWSDRFVFTTDTNSALPVVPTSVTWVVSDDAFVAGWAPVVTDTTSGVSFVTSYELEFTATGTSKIITVPQKTGGNLTYTLTFAENVALFGTAKPSVDLRIRAVNNKGAKGAWSGSINAVNGKPAAPTGFAANGLPDAVELAWTANTDPDLSGYNIYVGTPGTFTPSAGNKIFSGNVTRFVYRTTTYSTQFFKIRAVDKFGQESDLPDTSASATPSSPAGVDTTAPATPTGLAATLVTSANAETTQANVTWNANSETDLAGYIIRYRKTGDTNWSFQNVGKVTAASIIGLLPYINYDFQIQAVDFSANESAASSTVVGTGATNAAPSQPQAPGVASNTLQIQVTPTGNRQSDGTAMAADIEYYEVYASNTAASFTPGPTNQLGVIPVGPAMAATFQIPASGNLGNEVWYAKVIAVDTGGLKGPASPSATATPTLISATNIVDASITTAKIINLTADKITAGSGLINNITVKSTLTIGDATTAGSIQSFDYSAGSFGYKMASTGGTASLEINQGVIRAPALAVQIGKNIIHPKWADFEANNYPASAVWPATSNTSLSVTIDTTTKYTNSQSLRVSNLSGASRTVYFGDSATDYHTRVEGGTRYIVSAYIFNAGGASVTGSLMMKLNDATSIGATNQTFANIAGWTRYHFVMTTSAGATAALAGITLTGTGTLLVDAVQIEPAINNQVTTGSPFALPGMTMIDGGLIRTGEIRSINNTAILNPTTGLAEPVWSIPLNGAATFSAMRVLGNTVIGNGSGDNVSTMSSSNFIPGSAGAGWQLKATGEASFKQVTADGFAGSIIARNDDPTSDGYGSTVALAGTGFFVKGSTAKGNPDYITFPTSGSPNIISGTLQAETLTVSGLIDANGVRQGASFRGINHFELDSEVSLDNAIGQPLAGPTLTATVPKATFKGGPTDCTRLAYDSSTNKFWRAENLVVLDSIVNKVHRFALDGTWEAGFAIPRPAPPAGGNMVNSEIADIVKMGSFWYVLWDFTGTGSSVLSKHNDDATWSLVSKADIAAFGSGSSSTQYLGKDATQLLICSWDDWTLTGATRQPVIRHYDASTLAYTGVEITCNSYPLAATTAEKGGNLAAVMGGEFDYGSGNKTYILVFNYGAAAPITTTMRTFNTSGVTQPTREWEIENFYPGMADGMVYDTGHDTAGGNFYHVGRTTDDFYKYVPNMWTSGSIGWGFAYSFYKNAGRVVSTTANGTTTITAVGGAGSFLTTDVGADISGGTVPVGTKISAVATDGATATASAVVPTSAAFNLTVSYETATSPQAQVLAKKRRTYTMTGAIGPAGTVVRTYIGRGPTGSTYPTTLQLALQGTLAGGIVSYSTGSTPNFAGVPPKTTGTFPPGTPARIYSQQTYSLSVTPVLTTSGSATVTGVSGATIFYKYMEGMPITGPGIQADTKVLAWNSPTSVTLNKTANATSAGTGVTLTITYPRIDMRGDGFTSVYELYGRQTILTSTQDVNTNAGNTPPLRLGNIYAGHMRMDGDEFQAMSDDTTPSIIRINAGGGSIKLGANSGTFRSVDMGFRNLSANASGVDTVPHQLGVVPDVILVTSFTTAAFRHVQVQAKTATNFTVVVQDAAGAGVANSTLQISWLAYYL